MRPGLLLSDRRSVTVRIGLLAMAVTVLVLALMPAAKASAACVPISFGAQPTTGTIAAAGQSDCYSFSGAAGDRVWIRVVRTSGPGGLDPEQTVLRPDSSTSCSGTTADERGCQLDVAGTHTIVVRDQGSMLTGSYSIAIQRLNQPTGCVSLPYGSPIVGTGNGEFQCYRFSATAGDRLRLIAAFANTSQVPAPTYHLFSPDGADLCATGGTSECAVLQTGTHTVVVALPSGSMGISVQNLDTPVGCTALPGPGAPSRTVTQGGGHALAELDCFTYLPILAADRARFRVAELNDTQPPGVDAYQPGQPRCSGSAHLVTEITCLSHVAGRYNIFVSPTGSSGKYEISATTLNDPTGCTPVAAGDPPLTITQTTTATSCFSFTGAAGSRYRFRSAARSNAITLKQEVIKPDGTTLCETTSLDLSCTMINTGTHTVFVGPATYNPNSTSTPMGTWYFSRQRLDAPTGCRAISYGALPEAGTLTPGEMDCFRFTGADGDVLRLWTHSPTSNAVTEIIGRDGSTMCAVSMVERSCTLGPGGLYTMIIHDSDSNTRTQPVDYTTSIQRMNNPVGCFSQLPNGGLPTAGSITLAGRWHCFTFSAQLGDQVWIHTVELNGSLALKQALFAPDGSTTCTPAGLQDVRCQVQQSGIHTVLVHDGGTKTGDYRISARRLNSADGCTALTRGEAPVTASMTRAGEMDCFLVPATAGDRVRIRIAETSGTLVATPEIERQNGTSLCSAVTTTELTCTADSTGNLRILVLDAVGTGKGDYAISAQRLNPPAGCLPLSGGAPARTGTIAAGEVDCLRFSATAGQTVTTHVSATSGTLAATHEVLRPDGTTLCGPTSAVSQSCAIASSGTYSVLIIDAAGSGTGGYTVSLSP
jgi:hypothetical protein